MIASMGYLKLQEAKGMRTKFLTPEHAKPLNPTTKHDASWENLSSPPPLQKATLNPTPKSFLNPYIVVVLMIIRIREIKTY